MGNEEMCRCGHLLYEHYNYPHQRPTGPCKKPDCPCMKFIPITVAS